MTGPEATALLAAHYLAHGPVSPARVLTCVSAQTLVGVPCPWGGNGPLADCSGFVLWCLAVAGVEPYHSHFPPRLGDRHAVDLTANKMWEQWTPVAEAAVLPGDVACYPGHVVLVTVVDITGTILATTGASGTHAGLTSLDECVSRGAVVRQRLHDGTRAPHHYRDDFRGFRSPPYADDLTRG